MPLSSNGFSRHNDAIPTALLSAGLFYDAAVSCKQSNFAPLAALAALDLALPDFLYVFSLKSDVFVVHRTRILYRFPCFTFSLVGVSYREWLLPLISRA